MPGHGPGVLAVVAIGRNEGERLRLCLRSAKATEAACVVYVDSGSTDASVALARELGCEVVNLDMSIPFTAARARNAGLEHARSCRQDLTHVQFLDGDCELDPGWIALAMSFLQQHPQAAAACGRRRERFPERSVYNRLCDEEWNTPIGLAKACGGDALFVDKALAEVGGYREDLIAGEEPELCVRLRGLGWQIWRLDAEMTLHDAAILHLSQWWKRARRGGFAYAQGAAIHGEPPERHWVDETRRALAWGAGLPLLILLTAAVAWPFALALAALYPLQLIRLARREGLWPRAAFLVLAKFPEAVGVIQYHLTTGRGQRAGLIEYK